MATYDLNEFVDDEGNIYNFSDDEARRIASSALDLAEETRLAANGIGETCEGYVWLGENIATKFAEEIGSTDPITWLKQRAAMTSTGSRSACICRSPSTTARTPR